MPVALHHDDKHSPVDDDRLPKVLKGQNCSLVNIIVCYKEIMSMSHSEDGFQFSRDKPVGKVK